MTDRERWIIYPLLFLALGLAAKDKMAKWTTIKTVSCERLIVTDRGGQQRLVATVDAKGDMTVDSLGGRTYFDTVACNRLAVTDRRGHDRVVATGNADGGLVQIEGPHKNSKLMMGFVNDVLGVLFDVQGAAKIPPSIAVSAESGGPIGPSQHTPGSGRKPVVGPPQPERPE